MWFLSDKQLANITPKLKKTIKCLKREGMLRYSETPQVKLVYQSGYREWWLHINGEGFWRRRPGVSGGASSQTPKVGGGTFTSGRVAMMKMMG